jgi:hypothetical protein
LAYRAIYKKAGPTTRSRPSMFGYRAFLITSVSISVTVHKTLSEVLPVQLSVTQARTVISVRVAIVFLIAVLETFTVVTILTAFLNPFVVACVQSSLAKLERTTVAVPIIVITPIALCLALATSLLAFEFALTPNLIPLPRWILILGLGGHSDSKKER